MRTHVNGYLFQYLLLLTEKNLILFYFYFKYFINLINFIITPFDVILLICFEKIFLLILIKSCNFYIFLIKNIIFFKENILLYFFNKKYYIF